MQHICKQKPACPAPHTARVCLLIAITSFSCPACRQHRGVLTGPEQRLTGDRNTTLTFITKRGMKNSNSHSRRQASNELLGSLLMITISIAISVCSGLHFHRQKAGSGMSFGRGRGARWSVSLALRSLELITVCPTPGPCVSRLHGQENILSCPVLITVGQRAGGRDKEVN